MSKVETQKLKLKTSAVLQGDFALGSVNVLLVFQVNCPGCFIYAFPIANKIVEDFAEQGVRVLGVSTAFEDFEFNTERNTQGLIADGQLVGVTYKTLKKSGFEKLPFKLNFDIAFDFLSPMDKGRIGSLVKDYCQDIPGFDQSPAKEKEQILSQTKAYLSAKEYWAHTFDENQLNGTPSWIIFDKNKDILFKHFGHVEYTELKRILDRVLEK